MHNLLDEFCSGDAQQAAGSVREDSVKEHGCLTLAPAGTVLLWNFITLARRLSNYIVLVFCCCCCYYFFVILNVNTSYTYFQHFWTTSVSTRFQMIAKFWVGVLPCTHYCPLLVWSVSASFIDRLKVIQNPFQSLLQSILMMSPKNSAYTTKTNNNSWSSIISYQFNISAFSRIAFQ